MIQDYLIIRIVLSHFFVLSRFYYYAVFYCKFELYFFVDEDLNNSRHLGRRDAAVFALGLYLFIRAHSLPRAWQGQISQHIFAPNGGYCVYY